ncbi:hypothetical protein MKW92_052119 [Papaver armeniacum]|nr:hypothetical protein MKW92_052119 [Papaver armeniacum]
MTTIREVRCDDLLELTSLTIGQTVMAPLRDLMSIMTEFPEYSLVCVSPGNRITGFIAAYNTGEGAERHCAINEIHYLRAEMFLMLMKAIEGEGLRSKFYLLILLSDYDEVFFGMGYTRHREYFDVIGGELVNKSILRKNLSGGDLHL